MSTFEGIDFRPEGWYTGDSETETRDSSLSTSGDVWPRLYRKMMRRELTEAEYNELMGTYDINHFMGGIRGSDDSKIIFLVGTRIILADRSDDNEDIEAEQLTEAEKYFAEYEQ